MQKGCKKDFDKNQYTKKFVFQCHTVTHGIDLRKSPLICFLFLTVRRIPVMPEHARIASFKLVYFRFICFGVGLGGGWFVMLDLEACSTKYGK